jgi:hypothetical protein
LTRDPISSGTLIVPPVYYIKFETIGLTVIYAVDETRVFLLRAIAG